MQIAVRPALLATHRGNTKFVYRDANGLGVSVYLTTRLSLTVWRVMSLIGT